MPFSNAPCSNDEGGNGGHGDCNCLAEVIFHFTPPDIKLRTLGKSDYSMTKLLFHGQAGYSKGQILGPACWPHQDLLAVQEGELLLQTAKGSIHLNSGDAVWIPPRLRFHGSIETDKGLIWVIHFSGRAAPSSASDECGLLVYRRGVTSDLAARLMERIHLLHRGDDWPPQAVNYLSALLSEVEHNGASQQDEQERFFRTLEKWCRENLSKAISLEDMARQVGLSTSHFRKLFRERYGVSAGKFLQELRFNEAGRLLQESLLSLKEVSYQVGYADATSFSRAFAKQFQIAPAQWRKKQRSII